MSSIEVKIPDCSPMQNPPPGSAITGLGYGSCHLWARGSTAQVGSWGLKRTEYRCQTCEEKFTHHYAHIQDIHEAMQCEEVRNTCSKPASIPAALSSTLATPSAPHNWMRLAYTQSYACTACRRTITFGMWDGAGSSFAKLLQAAGVPISCEK